MMGRAGRRGFSRSISPPASQSAVRQPWGENRKTKTGRQDDKDGRNAAAKEGVEQRSNDEASKEVGGAPDDQLIRNHPPQSFANHSPTIHQSFTKHSFLLAGYLTAQPQQPAREYDRKTQPGYSLTHSLQAMLVHHHHHHHHPPQSQASPSRYSAQVPDSPARICSPPSANDAPGSHGMPFRAGEAPLDCGWHQTDPHTLARSLPRTTFQTDTDCGWIALVGEFD